jgi:hypothetical protein
MAGDVAEESGHGGARDLVEGSGGDVPLPGWRSSHANGGDDAEAPTSDDDTFTADSIGVLGDWNIDSNN